MNTIVPVVTVSFVLIGTIALVEAIVAWELKDTLTADLYFKYIIADSWLLSGNIWLHVLAAHPADSP